MNIMNHLEENICKHLFLEWLISQNAYNQWINVVLKEEELGNYYVGFLNKDYINPAALLQISFTWVTNIDDIDGYMLNVHWTLFLNEHIPVIKHLCKISGIHNEKN